MKYNGSLINNPKRIICLRNLSHILFILVFLLAACALKSFTEKDLTNIKLTRKDLPPEFVQSLDSGVQKVAPNAASLLKALFTDAAAGKIINTTMFGVGSSNSIFRIISFDYFPLSTPEKQEVLPITKSRICPPVIKCLSISCRAMRRPV